YSPPATMALSARRQFLGHGSQHGQPNGIEHGQRDGTQNGNCDGQPNGTQEASINNQVTWSVGSGARSCSSSHHGRCGGGGGWGGVWGLSVFRLFGVFFCLTQH